MNSKPSIKLPITTVMYLPFDNLSTSEKATTRIGKRKKNNPIRATHEGITISPRFGTNLFQQMPIPH